jgi:tRNA (cytidine/uridine-2'-O-)-methyltransferase
MLEIFGRSNLPPALDVGEAARYRQGMKYEPKLHVVLHQPEIPHNTGSVGRTCVAVGAKLWLVRPLGFRIDDYYLRRAGLDYWEHLECEVVDDWNALTAKLNGQSPGHRLWFFTKTAARTYTSVKFEHRDVLVFGSESNGLPQSLLEPNRDRALRIPVREQVRSLNLSNSVAIVAYEALRQWE